MLARVRIHKTARWYEVPSVNQAGADIVIGLPLSIRHVAEPWVEAMQRLAHPRGLKVRRAATQDLTYSVDNIGKARNKIVAHAMDAGVRYILFIDDDVELPQSALVELLTALKANPRARVCAGIYCKKDPPPDNHPVVWDENGTPILSWTPGMVFECGSIGAGCMLMDASVFDEISAPWFGLGADEDIHFCTQVRKAGYQVLAHGGVICPHWEIQKDRAHLCEIRARCPQS